MHVIIILYSKIEYYCHQSLRTSSLEPILDLLESFKKQLQQKWRKITFLLSICAKDFTYQVLGHMLSPTGTSGSSANKARSALQVSAPSTNEVAVKRRIPAILGKGPIVCN